MLEFHKNKKVSVYFRFKEEGVIVDQYIKNKRKYNIHSYSQFQNLLKNGNLFGFPKNMLLDYIEQNSKEFNKFIQKAKEEADFAARWADLRVCEAKQSGDESRVVKVRYEADRIRNDF